MPTSKKAMPASRSKSERLKEGCERNGVEVGQWLHSVQKWCLRKKDVDAMKPGQQVCAICLDRNVLDIAFAHNPERRAVDASHFFRKNIVTYTNYRAPFGFLNDEGTETRANGQQLFVFEVQLDSSSPYDWYPLSSNGTLPVHDPQMLPRRKVRLHGGRRPKKWAEFAPTTLVGWRGPMLPLSRLKDLPERLQKVWYDSAWPGVSCVSWGATMRTIDNAYVPQLAPSVLERQCEAAKQFRLPRRWKAVPSPPPRTVRARR